MTGQEFFWTASTEEFLRKFPDIRDMLRVCGVGELEPGLPMPQALAAARAELARQGLSPDELVVQISELVDFGPDLAAERREVNRLTVTGGRDKSGTPENTELTIDRGQVVSIVGPTGSGKSQLLADIECLAQGDTPTGRRVLVNGEPLDDEQRLALEGDLVAQLSQNMNFVLDLSASEFLCMHAESRAIESSHDVVARCLDCANDLAGEEFEPATPVTRLSGGQSRALMIADTAILCASPIVLIDEIENAGIDRSRAIRLLAGEQKIVLVSTHDPILALDADMRIVIAGGGIRAVIRPDAQESAALERLERVDARLKLVRTLVRRGDRISIDDVGELV
ncbi:ATP-binding cassette domain-containing protein [Propionibacterium sp.]|uniref:ATP-binding cassette domain-containing protein n=1 Tax=Propionibacterium sp. TaxID=1977903 RepID=UPI0039ECDC1D